MIKLPMPPSTNSLFRNVAGVGRVQTKTYKRWRKEAGWALKEQKVIPVSAAYFLDITVERKGRRDISNCIKAIEDLLVRHQVTPDDEMCQGVNIRWSKTVEKAPTVRVVVT